MWNMAFSDHFIYQALIQLTAHDPQVHVTYEQLQAQLEFPVCYKTVQRAVARLESAGLIKRYGGGAGSGYRYELVSGSN